MNFTSFLFIRCCEIWRVGGEEAAAKREALRGAVLTHKDFSSYCSVQKNKTEKALKNDVTLFQRMP